MSEKKLLFSLLGLTMLGLSSCSDDPASQTDVYQQYHVVITPDIRMAYANFRDGTAAGDQLKIDGSEAVKVNSMPMFFISSASPNYNGYNYVCALPDNHEKIIFQVELGKTTLTNEFELNTVPEIVIPETLSEISNNIAYSLDLGTLSPSQVAVSLENAMNSNSTDSYKAEINLVSGGFMFTKVPAGTYRLCVDGTYSFATSENDGSAGGEIKVTRRSVKTGVVVAQ